MEAPYTLRDVGGTAVDISAVFLAALRPFLCTNLLCLSAISYIRFHLGIQENVPPNISTQLMDKTKRYGCLPHALVPFLVL